MLANEVIRRKSKISKIVIVSFNFPESAIDKFDGFFKFYLAGYLIDMHVTPHFFFSFFLRNNLLSLLVERMLLGSIS